MTRARGRARRDRPQDLAPYWQGPDVGPDAEDLPARAPENRRMPYDPREDPWSPYYVPR